MGQGFVNHQRVTRNHWLKVRLNNKHHSRWQIVGEIRARKITETAPEFRVKLSPLERRIVFETTEHNVKPDAGLLTMILSRGGEGKLELWDGCIPLAARFETRDEYNVLVKNISRDLESLDWMPSLKIETNSSDEGYLHIKLPFAKDFLDWFYQF